MSDSSNEYQAWLEAPGVGRVPITGSCSLGRSVSNQVVVPDENVSRRHALIQVQRQYEFWLVDFGSRNGTYLNDQRMIRPTRLRDGDRIKVGHVEFSYRQPRMDRNPSSITALSDRTASDIRPATCWLMVADIINSTQLVKQVAPDELPLLTGLWLADCKQTIESRGGRINQFLGDGFFAYWHDRIKTEVAVAAALESLQRLQEQGRPQFRLAVHLGSVMIGGVSVGEEERISGSAVHFVFRSEKLAGKLGESRLLTESAWGRLAALLPARNAGVHSVAGFDGQFSFYAF